MADMPGESQEEPSVMVIAIAATIRLTSLIQMFFIRLRLLLTSGSVVTQHNTRAANYPSDFLVEIDRVKVLLRC